MNVTNHSQIHDYISAECSGKHSIVKTRLTSSHNTYNALHSGVFYALDLDIIIYHLTSILFAKRINLLVLFYMSIAIGFK